MDTTKWTDFVSLALAFVAGLAAFVQWRRDQSWKRANKLDSFYKEFNSRRQIRIACRVLDWSCGKFEIAKGDDPEANRAMAELASLRDNKVVDLLVKELGKESSFARAFAARNLVLMGELARAAKALADAEPYVRASAACAVLGRDD